MRAQHTRDARRSATCSSVIAVCAMASSGYGSLAGNAEHAGVCVLVTAIAPPNVDASPQPLRADDTEGRQGESRDEYSKILSAALDDPASVAAFRSRLLELWKRDIQVLEERRQAIQWQAWTSRVMFWTVHFFLLVACAAAAMEFVSAYRKRREAPTAKDLVAARVARVKVKTAKCPEGGETAQAEPGGACPSMEPDTELKFGLEGLALKTALHGLLILALAMGFYFLYLRFVFPIRELEQPAAQMNRR